MSCTTESAHHHQELTCCSSTVDRYCILDHDGTVIASATDYVPTTSINEWLQRSPNATATLTLFDGDTIDLPVYTLRRRNAVVANLPDAPSMTP
ncbi:hypothetical protein O0I10_002324 [Lichtheimia ornata]|uniref:Uncharacterized protein n=1 Tax=Lichtheimia ornata TaxID=688661 RepID=A0AAD7VB96_9FUNG|nr:uncharacterized protein O0I10_002324 [Lichtheimia ornata]KAJ8661993.1 hypothetical protein O0I10_002324 [Lichtheimia ornata]